MTKLDKGCQGSFGREGFALAYSLRVQPITSADMAAGALGGGSPCSHSQEAEVVRVEGLELNLLFFFLFSLGSQPME